jgi:putative ABC transport system substrate-binding protein
MIDRRAFITTLAGIVVSPLAGEAQQAEGTRRVGLLSLRNGPSVFEEAFRQGLRELGWVEGRNVAFEYRWAAGRLDHLPALAEGLVRAKVDLIVTSTTRVAAAAKNATKTIPIVMAVAAEAVENGVVTSLARPGGNVTGLSEPYAPIHAKLLGLLHETLPEVTRVAFLGGTTSGTVRRTRDALQAAAPSLGLTIRAFERRHPPSSKVHCKR